MFIISVKEIKFTSLFNSDIRKDMKIMIGFRVTSEFKEFLQKLADRENRTLSSFLYNALIYYIKKEHKLDWRKEKPKK